MERWQTINSADADEAARLLFACCGSTRWVARMLTRRPFSDRSAVLSAAREEWLTLDESDWREAFAQHPAIGDQEALRQRFPATHDLSSHEQAGATGASDEVLDALAAGNRQYAEKFGYIFIVRATGRSAEEMLTMLRERLNNTPREELLVAAEQQAQITALRLAADSSTSRSAR
jgi:2-oxo-4-hydroxy-4-carboxy-5-ureidoimidazoline decarboxylase